MRKFLTLVISVSFIIGCGGWGDFKYNSDRFGYKITFPNKWEVWDKSNDEVDFLEATLPEDIPDAKITVRAIPIAPDVTPSEIYPTFLDGSEYGEMDEFSIQGRGAVSAKDSEGRYLKFTYMGPEKRMRAMKTMFIGERMVLEITMEMNADVFMLHEVSFSKMIKRIELY